MVSTHTEEKTIKSTRTAFAIIESVAELQHPTVSEIAENVGRSRSTVHYHLKTFQQEGYVIADDEGLRLGLRMARLGMLSLRNHRLSDVVEEPAEDLAAETDATAHVAVQEGGTLVWLYRSATDDDLPMAVGMETPIHTTAYGQAILADMPPDAVSDLVDEHGLPAVTSETLTDPDALGERLDTVRELGFAYSAGEYVDGISSIAAPIVDEDDGVVGAIGITAPSDRIGDPYRYAKAHRFSDKLPGLVRRAAQIVSDHYADR